MAFYTLLIREAREHYNLSQTQLAEHSGVARITIAHLETTPNANPSIATLDKLARAMGLAATDLIECIPGPNTQYRHQWSKKE